MAGLIRVHLKRLFPAGGPPVALLLVAHDLENLFGTDPVNMVQKRRGQLVAQLGCTQW